MLKTKCFGCFAHEKLSEAFKSALDDGGAGGGSGAGVVDDDADGCQLSTVDPATAERDFGALQYALFAAVAVDIAAGALYLAVSWTVGGDKRRVAERLASDAAAAERLAGDAAAD